MLAVSRLISEPTASMQGNTQSRLSVSAQDGIDQLLSAVRVHLGMDVAFISEFVGDKRYFRHVDATSGNPLLQVGDSMALDDGYCKKVIDGELPELIVDTADVPGALAIPATQALPIGSHVSVPLMLSDERIFGTFCCFSHLADRSLNMRDLDVMRAFAAVVAHHIETDLANHRHYHEARQKIEAVLASNLPDMVYQPIYDLKNLTIVGAEALSRFPVEPLRSPDFWFAEAGVAGLKTELEQKAIVHALKGFKDVWQREDIYLGLNCSPQTIIDTDWSVLFKDAPMNRIMLEVTEHDHVEDYEKLIAALKPLREKGVKISVDDAGAGYASMGHILNLKPEVIKLDISLTQKIDGDRMRQALAGALISFANQIGSKVVAEGIETAAELRKLSELGAHAGQGYFLGKPLEIEGYRGLVLRANKASGQTSQQNPDFF